MITVRPSADRLHTQIGWLDSRHSFSFAEHYDPRYMSYRALRVLNENRITPGHGFGMHPHRDLEIVTYMIGGALQHQDSLGTGSVIRRGDVQRITAGTGVLHSERNASDREEAHLLQLWIAPRRARLAPSYEQRHFAEHDRRNRLRLIASSDGREGSLTIHQDVAIYSSLLTPGAVIAHRLEPARHAWLQVITGAITLNDVTITSGDAAAVAGAAALRFRSAGNAEVLLIDLA
jgi:redox-sensitive bicupin YhaK (pirin superfamily)